MIVGFCGMFLHANFNVLPLVLCMVRTITAFPFCWPDWRGYGTCSRYVAIWGHCSTGQAGFAFKKPEDEIVTEYVAHWPTAIGK